MQRWQIQERHTFINIKVRCATVLQLQLILQKSVVANGHLEIDFLTLDSRVTAPIY